MRVAERFLVAFAVVSLIMRYLGMKDGVPVQMIGWPLLALFYIFAIPFLLNRIRLNKGWKTWIWKLAGGILAGLAFAYCIISALLFSIGEVSRRDMLENCSIILGGMLLITLFGLLRKPGQAWKRLGIRATLLFALVLMLAFFPLPSVALLHR